MRYAVISEKTPTGYAAYAPDLPGCIATGDTLDGTKTLMKEAVEGHVELMRERGYAIPTPTTVAGYIEAVA